jgi:hypothetical protein
MGLYESCGTRLSGAQLMWKGFRMAFCQNDDSDAALKKLAGDGAEALMKKFTGANSAEVPKLPAWKDASARIAIVR